MNIKIIFRNLFFIFGTIFTLWLIFYYPNWNELNKLKHLSSGCYITSLNESDSLTKEEVKYYSEIWLELDVNGSFLFSKPVPVGGGSYGKWKIIGSEIERRVKLEYKNGLEDQVSTCSKLGCIIRIQIPVYEKNMLMGHKFLAFKKISC